MLKKIHLKNTSDWFFLGMVDPSRNRLKSTAHLAISSSVFCMRGWIFFIYIFRVTVIFVLKIWSIFDEFSPITRIIKIAKIGEIYFPFISVHSGSFIKIWPLRWRERREVCISLLGTGPCYVKVWKYIIAISSFVLRKRFLIWWAAFSQLRICRASSLPLNFDPVFMNDAECAE